MDNQITTALSSLIKRQNTSVTRAESAIVDEVRLSALKASGALALSAYISEAVVDLDEDRRALARRAGPELNAVLIEIEVAGIEQAQKVQRGLYRNLKI